jgi:hypothetical protein
MKAGGYTEIMRKDEQITRNSEFDKTFDEYQFGFGSNKKNYWLGLSYMSELTSNKTNPMILRIEMSFNKKKHSITYSDFSVGNYEEGFVLNLGKKISGDLDDWSAEHTNVKFSAHNEDVDGSDVNCARSYLAGWWFTGCYRFCLTCDSDEGVGNYFHLNEDGTLNHSINFRSIKMMILPQIALNDINDEKSN